MDIWEEMYLKAREEYHPEEISPFIQAHHVVSAVQSESGKIFTGFCIEGASGVMNLCAERVAVLNMYINTGETKIKRMIAFRNEPPKVNGGMPYLILMLRILISSRLFNYSNEIRNAVMIVLGENAHSCYMEKDAYEDMIKDSKYTDNKELLIIPNATHTDLYDLKDRILFDEIDKFLKKNI